MEVHIQYVKISFSHVNVFLVISVSSFQRNSLSGFLLQKVRHKLLNKKRISLFSGMRIGSHGNLFFLCQINFFHDFFKVIRPKIERFPVKNLNFANRSKHWNILFYFRILLYFLDGKP